MFTYKYLDVDECWLKSPMPQQSFKLQMSLNFATIEQNAWRVINGHVSFKMVGVHITLVLPYTYLATYSLYPARHAGYVYHYLCF